MSIALSTAPSVKRWRANLERHYPGVLAAGTIGLAASWLAQHYQTPVMLFALLIGMAFHFLHEDGKCVAGIDFVSKAVLRIGVALLGVRITMHDIMGLGFAPIATVLLGTGSTILAGMFVARLLGRSRSFGVLTGGAVGICGASAALAISSVLPHTPERERDTILTVVVVTALSTIAMVVYPMITSAADFDHAEAGIFLGATIHDVAQVVGAGYTISPETGDISTYVKLLRVSLLLPVIFAIMLVLRGRGAPGAKADAPIPYFLLGFAALVALGSFGFLPAPFVAGANEASRWCLVAAVAALGVKTSFRALAEAGWRSVLIVAIETVWLAALVFVAIRMGT